MPKSDKISEKYVESVTKVNNDPFFQEYMSQEEDQRKMQNSLIKEAEDTGYEKGIKFGEEKGLKLGEEKGKIDIAKRLLKMHMNKEDIIKATGLTLEEINKIITA